jgi:serine O-acetyltransferase
LYSSRRDGEARGAPSRDAPEVVLNGLIEALSPGHRGQFDFDAENIDW